jgi:uroporphyrin-III C-methyltransferase/precorrin-2 dehydrogenase/sirohydrochlorin ferrochelatase
MLACLRAGVPVTVVPGVSSAVGVPTAAGVPVTHRGTAQDFHVISVHVPPGDERSTVDWVGLAKTDGTLVLLMALERLGDVARTLIRHGRPGNCPVSVIADGTMPTQRTIYSTLDQVERHVADEEIRPPAVVVIGGVVTIATELAGLARRLAGHGQATTRRLRSGGVSSLVPRWRRKINEHKSRRDEWKERAGRRKNRRRPE